MCDAGVENKGSVCEILPPKLYVYIYPVLEMSFCVGVYCVAHRSFCTFSNSYSCYMILLQCND
jgi:hypothetical protein